jgi:hypothetical protein
MSSDHPKNQEKLLSQPETKTKKPYTKPDFRCERVFETSAAGCGKTVNQGGCHRAVKTS